MKTLIIRPPEWKDYARFSEILGEFILKRSPMPGVFDDTLCIDKGSDPLVERFATENKLDFERWVTLEEADFVIYFSATQKILSLMVPI